MNFQMKIIFLVVDLKKAKNFKETDPKIQCESFLLQYSTISLKMVLLSLRADKKRKCSRTLSCKTLTNQGKFGYCSQIFKPPWKKQIFLKKNL